MRFHLTMVINMVTYARTQHARRQHTHMIHTPDTVRKAIKDSQQHTLYVIISFTGPAR